MFVWNETPIDTDKIKIKKSVACKPCKACSAKYWKDGTTAKTKYSKFKQN